MKRKNFNLKPYAKYIYAAIFIICLALLRTSEVMDFEDGIDVTSTVLAGFLFTITIAIAEMIDRQKRVLDNVLPGHKEIKNTARKQRQQLKSTRSAQKLIEHKQLKSKQYQQQVVQARAYFYTQYQKFKNKAENDKGEE